MKRISRPAFSFRGAWLYLELGDVQMHIIEHASAPGSQRSIDTLAQHFAMAVDDLDVAEEHLKAMGIEYKRQKNAGGFQQIFFHDPDGNMIEVGIYPHDRSGWIDSAES